MILVALLFNLAWNISIGLKSGEYDDKKISLHPAFTISLCVSSDLWKVVLSIITTCPGFNSRVKINLIQALNKLVLHVP